jgi:hypothetical protein
MINFLGIGAQKAGTSWLYEKMKLHPDIAFPAGKEVHFWDKKKHQGLDWYCSLFSDQKFNGKKCGEFTPAYSVLPVDTIELCHSHFPDLKLIFLLRNPIDRAWSSAKMELRRTKMSIIEASDQWFVDHFKSDESLMRGDYESCLRNWLEYYHWDQLMVCFFEELLETPDTLLKKCFNHINVSSNSFDWRMDLKQPVNKGIQGDIPRNLRSVLEDIYHPKIKSLQDYLQMNLEIWH